MRFVIAGLLLTLGLSACGSSDEPKSAPKPTDSTTSAGITDLKTACDQLGEAIPHEAGGTLDRGKMREFLDDAAAVNNAGGTEVRSAVRPVIEATAAIINSNGPKELLAAHMTLLDALKSFNPLCQAAGSKAWS